MSSADNRPEPCFTPDARKARHSQLASFISFCSEKERRLFHDYAEFERFSVERNEAFWLHFLKWSGLPYSGAPDPVCVGQTVEEAVFFPYLKLNCAECLLAGGNDLPAIIECRAGTPPVRLSRMELRERTRRAAQGLARLGVGPGDRIVAIAYNDAEAVIACLAAAAVGATFSAAAPDMEAPAILARFRQLSPTILFTHTEQRPGNHLAETVPAVIAGLPSLRAVVTLDAEETTPARGVPHLSLNELSGSGMVELEWKPFDFNHPLFILFSSGTTGAPKCIIHGAGGTVLEHAKELRLHCDLRPGERLFFQTSTAWMMWNWQLSALACRAAIVLYDRPISGAETLWSIAAEHDVDVLGTSPAYLKLCESAGYTPFNLHSFPRLRAVLSTGSVLYDSQFDWVMRQVKRVPVQSISGGTDIIGCFVLGNPMLPVYRGEAQCRSLGLDVAAWDAAPGEIGELVCRNPFPSRPLGFCGDTDRSRFHEAYFSQNPGVWTHGDRISFTPYGTARLHGRSDGVLNVRGIRIGTAEIYAALQDIAELREAMAVEQERPDMTAGGRIVLLVVLSEGVVLNGALALRLRRQIARRTAPYYVPGAIVDVPDLPTTHSGKRSEVAARDALNGRPCRNLSALRNPGSLRAITEHPGLRTERAGYPAPEGGRSAEEILATLWSHALGVENVGLDDNFFELGGDSLLAVAICTGFEEVLGYDLPIAALFQHPTIRSLARVVESGVVWQGNSPLVTLRSGEGNPVFLLHSVSGNIFEWHYFLKHLPAGRPVAAMQARGLDPDTTPSDSVQAMAADYVDLIRARQPQGPYTLMGYSFGGLLAYEIAVRLSRAGQDIEFLGLIDTDVQANALPPVEWLRFRCGRMWHLAQRVTALHLSGTLERVLRKAGYRSSGVGRHQAMAAESPTRALPPVLRRVRTACERAFTTYNPPDFAGVVTFFQSSERRPQFCDPLMVWRRRAASVCVVPAPGTHTTMMLEPDVGSLAAAVAQFLRGPLAARVSSRPTHTMPDFSGQGGMIPTGAARVGQEPLDSDGPPVFAGRVGQTYTGGPMY